MKKICFGLKRLKEKTFKLSLLESDMEIKTISASRILLYEWCPTAYYYRYVEHVKVPQLPPLFFGEFLHAFLARFWNKKGEPSYTNAEAFANAGEAYFSQWVKGNLKRRKRKIAFENKSQINKYKSRLRKILISFYLNNKDLPKPIEIEKPHIFEWKGFRIYTRPDRVDEINKKKIIIDYKLGNPDKKKLKLYSLQFTLHSLAFKIENDEDVPVLWYSLTTGDLFLTERNEEDYEEAYERIAKFKENIEKNNFPKPNFDNPYCPYCEYAVVCAERYGKHFKNQIRRLERLLRIEGLEKREISSRSLLKFFYEGIKPEQVRSFYVGKRKYVIFGNPEKIKRVLSLRSFSSWTSKMDIIEEKRNYVKLEAETRMPKNLRERLEKESLEIYEKLRKVETEIVDAGTGTRTLNGRSHTLSRRAPYQFGSSRHEEKS